jgi:hypothetical protein
MQRQYPQRGRALALEAGEAMHQFFAAMRVWQLHFVDKLPDHAMSAGLRIFGEARWRDIWKIIKKEKGTFNQLGTLATEVLRTSGYYDDPNDDIRTLSNMETASVVYARETYPYLEQWPIWVADPKAPEKAIGVEQIFDVVLEYDDGKRIRYIGTLDGILRNTVKKGRVTMAENKTASRLDRAWIESFKMRHQVTGYMACGQALFGVEMWHARIYGCKIKPTYRGEDVHIEPVVRDQASINHWANWVYNQVEIFETYQHNWEQAERRTHSCNRYFRPCTLIPFCADTVEGRAEQYSQMVTAQASPSERAISHE